MTEPTAGSDEVRALVVDRHRMFADVIRPVLEEVGIHVLASTAISSNATGAARRIDANLVLLDLALPDRSALELGKELLLICPEAKILAVTDTYEARFVKQVIEAGFHGYLTKDVPLAEFVDSVRLALAGTVVVARAAPPRRAADVAADRTPERLLASQLTPREREVLVLLVQGARSPEMVARLPITQNTLRSHVGNIFSKLGVHSRLEAAAFAARNGVLEDIRGF